MYRLTQKAKAAYLWDAMVIAGISWLLCSILAAIPFYWISHICLKSGIDSELLKVFSQPVNALFEAFLGFSSTGLTMMQQEGSFPLRPSMVAFFPRMDWGTRSYCIYFGPNSSE